MSEAPRREKQFYLDDKIGFAEKVLAYTADLDAAQFASGGMVYDAVLRNLELIGEAATRIPDDVRQSNPEMPWRMTIAIRNRLIHGYLGIDNDTLCSIVRDDVPELLQSLKDIRAGR